MSNHGEEAMQRAAAELPNGYVLKIGLENGAGWIELYDDNGIEIDFDEDTSATMTARINAAIEMAINCGGKP